MVDSATKARRFAASGRAPADALARRSAIPSSPSVAAARVASSDEATRAAATEGLLGIADLLASASAGARPDAAKRRALVALSTMVGALTLARLVTEPKLSDQLLRDVAKHVSTSAGEGVAPSSRDP